MRLALLLYFAVAVQTTWGACEFAWLNGARVDLPLIVVVSAGLLGGWQIGAVAGIAAGWLCGVSAAYNPGSFMVSRLVVGAVCGAFDQKLSQDYPFAPPLCMAGATLLAHGVFGIMSPANFVQAWPPLLGSVALNAVVGSALHPFIARYVLPRPLPQDSIRFV